MQDTMPTADGIHPNLKKLLLSIKDDINQSIAEAMDKLNKRIEETEKGLANLREHVNQGEAALERRISFKIESALEKFKNERLSAASGKEVLLDKREEAYHKCRRSLRVWPVKGNNLRDAFKVFLKAKLKLSDKKIKSLDGLDILQAMGKRARDRGEVLVCFETKEDRDSVKAMGINLAGQKDAGMAIHVPEHLLDNLLALNAVGYKIKANNGEGIKHSVKFDDCQMDIYLDILISGDWKKVAPFEAKQVLKKILPMPCVSRKLAIPDLTNLVKGKSEEKMLPVS